jgi:hypothetical protein
MNPDIFTPEKLKYLEKTAIVVAILLLVLILLLIMGIIQ